MKGRTLIRWRSPDDLTADLGSSSSGNVGKAWWCDWDVDNCVRHRFVRIYTRRKKLRYSDFIVAGYPHYTLQSDHDYERIYEWCDKHFKKYNVAHFGYTFFFQDKKQMSMFMMRWS